MAQVCAINRDRYIDILKGISIFMVVGVHTFKGTTDIYSVALRELLTIAVPLFLAISGYLLANKDLSTTENKILFWKKQIPKIYIPMFIWSLFFWGLDIVGGSNILKSTVYLLLCGFSIYYYIAVQCQMYLLLPYLKKCESWLVIFITLITLVIVSYLNRLFNILDIHPLLAENLCFEWLIFFYMGIKLRNSSSYYSLKLSLIILIVGWLLSIIETKWLVDNGIMAFGANKVSCYLMSVGFILVFLSPKLRDSKLEVPVFNGFAKLGEISFPIYLTHCFVILIVGVLRVSSTWLADWGIVLILDTIFVLLLKRFMPMRLHRYLGIA